MISVELFSTGDTPLNLSNVNFLAMDWKNMEKCQPYVIVQSKDLVGHVTGAWLVVVMCNHNDSTYSNNR